ncbi:MAG: SMI1/KNR4 family protein [Alphaproteobacteria bacterium]|nr:SMI1/KNR4 family protein [Alphaproteobacteria bacterium]
MSKKSSWQFLEADHHDSPDDFGNGATPEQIKAIENSLGVNFTDNYRKFLEIYDYAFVPGYIIYGVNSIEGRRKSNVFDNTKFYKEVQKWPGIENWYVISDDGCGNPIGIDPEGRVWLSDHDSGFEKIKLADDFEEFLYRVYTETLFEE